MIDDSLLTVIVHMCMDIFVGRRRVSMESPALGYGVEREVDIRKRTQ
jgi:hypothetical protein